jgi:radical SAM superfamily enzyme YgiQ (UPF0313 family)
MGILYVGTVLKEAGCDVKVIDSFPGFNEENIEKICSFNPDLVGVSVLTTGHRLAAKYTRLLKERLPQTRVCWGGVHASAIPRQVLEQEPVDFVVVGEGEETALEVCKKLSGDKNASLDGINGIVFRAKNGIVENPKRDFIQDPDRLPIPDRRLLESPAYEWYMSPPGIIRGQFLDGITTFYTTRGCPYNCIFCCSHETAGRKLRQRSVDNCLREIGYLKKEFHIKGLYFNDDTFGLDKKWLREFCRKLIDGKYGLVWGCQTRAPLATKETLGLMKAAGCVQVDIGCESGSDRILKNLRKDITVSDILQAFDSAKAAGIDTFATFIVGNPGETMEDVRKTEETARRIGSQVSFLILVPYPGSELFEMAKENGWLLDDQLHFAENWTNKQSEEPVMEINFKAAELVRIRAGLQNGYFWENNSKIFFGLLAHPFYLFRIMMAFFRNMALASQGKSSVLLEAIYQTFNEGLMKKYV